MHTKLLKDMELNLMDSDKQGISAMHHLSRLSKLAGYRKPQTASGSTARYFFYHLLKLKRKRGWK